MHVKARRIGDEFYFDHGWKKFREENCLVENDFLVFTHIENNVFKFKILELSTMCEKMQVMDEEENNNMMEDDGDDVDYDDNDVDDNDAEAGEDSDDDGDDERDDGDDDMMGEEEKDDTDDEVSDDDVSENIMKEKHSENVYKENSKSGHQHCRTCKACEFWHYTEDKIAILFFHFYMYLCMHDTWVSKHYQIIFFLGDIGSSSAGSNLEDDEIDAEMYIQPGNPHFIAKHSLYRPNELV